MPLNDQQIEAVRHTLSTGGWRDVMLPILHGKMRDLQKLLVLLPNERPEPYKSLDATASDAVIRGELRNCEWASVCFSNEVAVYDFNRRRDELDRHEAGPNGLSPQPLTPANP